MHPVQSWECPSALNQQPNEPSWEHPIVWRHLFDQKDQDSFGWFPQLQSQVKTTEKWMTESNLQRSGSWGMIERAFLKSSSPILWMSTSSMIMDPEVGSTIRAKAASIFLVKLALLLNSLKNHLPVRIELFPAPVLKRSSDYQHHSKGLNYVGFTFRRFRPSL